MTLRADVDSHVVFAVGRTCCKGVAAAAFYAYVLIVWMYISFHVDSGLYYFRSIPIVLTLTAPLSWLMLRLKKQGVNFTRMRFFKQVLIIWRVSDQSG